MRARLKTAIALLVGSFVFFAQMDRALAQTSFDGTYKGVSIGYGWNDLDTTKSVVVLPPAAPQPDRVGSTTNGLTGTIFLGHSIGIADKILAGLEGDFTWSDFKGVFHDDSYRTSWGATLRGRLGYEVKSGILAYATAGAAWLNIDVAPSGLGQFSNTLFGYVVGGGVEVATSLPLHTRLRFEYLYSKYENWNFYASTTVGEKLSPELQQIRFGIILPFGQ